MITLEFRGPTKESVMKNITKYWYSNFYGKRSFLDFLGDCILKQSGSSYIIIYNGPKPE